MRPAATPSAKVRTTSFPMRKRASADVSTGSAVRFTTRRRLSVPSASAGSFNPRRARGAGLERVGEILGFAGDLAIQELHDAHRIGRPAVIGENEFGDPQIAAADDTAHC